MEKLMVDQRKEEGALHAVLDRIQSASRSATPRANGDDVNPGEVKMMLVPETQLLQLVQERERALSLLKSFRDEGNAVIYRMYNVIKQKEKKNVELLATLETLQKSNERLRQIQRQVTNMTGSTSPYHQLNHNEISEHCKRCVEKEKIIEGQRKLVSELDELLRNADTTLLAMKGRAEAAEQQLREVLQERKAASPQSIVYVKEGEVPESAVGQMERIALSSRGTPRTRRCAPCCSDYTSRTAR
ncbi:hypothetical protein AGDE_13375 [Angomonas deanei]|uniref:Uncharacterized protein n=1 Tax=Angomonas deanei TaxID=59799 RepID=A0A7G2C4Q6_9TRYP|nr:hypothetical protein AGDE_13375 [Angomonas deanei]CAD2214599.1 hypothetical protein, conserved [Angomonas deanei]|eukprot:EPY22433.1 hypothetical protein AGDE_13375 [Angomonas deanei]